MQMIYNWIDEIPLSRPKRNIARDFSDGGKFDKYFGYYDNCVYHKKSKITYVTEEFIYNLPYSVGG
jgi:hypothetical protein